MTYLSSEDRVAFQEANSVGTRHLTSRTGAPASSQAASPIGGTQPVPHLYRLPATTTGAEELLQTYTEFLLQASALW